MHRTRTLFAGEEVVPNARALIVRLVNGGPRVDASRARVDIAAKHLLLVAHVVLVLSIASTVLSRVNLYN